MRNIFYNDIKLLFNIDHLYGVPFTCIKNILITTRNKNEGNDPIKYQLIFKNVYVLIEKPIDDYFDENYMRYFFTKG